MVVAIAIPLTSFHFAVARFKKQKLKFCSSISLFLHLLKTVTVAQLVRASDCGSEGRGFETPQSPVIKKAPGIRSFFY